MGLGDVKLYFVLGAAAGVAEVLVVFFVSVVLGAVASVAATIVRKRRGEEDYDFSDEEYKRLPRGAVVRGRETPQPPKKMRFHVVPFGPFIALATAVAIFGGDALIDFYARILGHMKTNKNALNSSIKGNFRVNRCDIDISQEI